MSTTRPPREQPPSNGNPRLRSKRHTAAMISSTAASPLLLLLLVVPQLSASHAATSPCRHAYAQPFSGSSIWNTPIGSGAILRPLFRAPSSVTFNTSLFHVDHEYVVGLTTESVRGGDEDKDTTALPVGDEATTVVDVVNQGWWGPPPPAANASSQCDGKPSANNTYCHCVVFGNTTLRLQVPYVASPALESRYTEEEQIHRGGWSSHDETACLPKELVCALVCVCVCVLEHRCAWASLRPNPKRLLSTVCSRICACTL